MIMADIYRPWYTYRSSCYIRKWPTRLTTYRSCVLSHTFLAKIWVFGMCWAIKLAVKKSIMLLVCSFFRCFHIVFFLSTKCGCHRNAWSQADGSCTGLGLGRNPIIQNLIVCMTSGLLVLFIYFGSLSFSRLQPAWSQSCRAAGCSLLHLGTW